MTVKDLKQELEKYKDDAEVILVDGSSGETFTPVIGSDDEEEGYLDNDIDGDTYCSICF